MAQIEMAPEIRTESTAAFAWLMATDAEDSPKTGPISLQHVEGASHRKRIVLLAEDNLPDRLVIEDAILRYGP